MQIEELSAFLTWFNEEVRQPNIPKLYQQLHAILQQNAQPNQQKQPFEQQKENLIGGVMAVDLAALNDAQLRFAEQIGLLALVGQQAKDTIEDVLFKNVIDVATSATRMQECQKALNEILQKMKQVEDGLSGYVEEAEVEYEEALVHVRFQRDSSITNVVELKQWGSAWYDIGRGVAMAHHLPPEDIKIIGASRGSLVVDLAVAYAVAKTLSYIILLVLKVAEKALDVRKKAEEIRGMQLTNDKAAIELEREADLIEENGQKEVLETIEAGTKVDGEQKTALTLSIKNIFAFLSGGGEVDIYVEEDEEAEDEGEPDERHAENQRFIAEIKESFTKIKQLEKKILLLSEGNPQQEN